MMTNSSIIYEYKGSTYKVVGTGEMKEPTTRQWVKCIIYNKTHSWKTNTDIFVREYKDFFEKFKRYDDTTSNNTGSEL